jgi:hypothetical protein
MMVLLGQGVESESKTGTNAFFPSSVATLWPSQSRLVEIDSS